VQWADDGLLDFIDELTARLRDAPLLVVCAARPELVDRRPGWGGGKANALTISLSPLSDAETAQLVASLERPPLAADALRALLARAGGNPLFAEQLARVEVEVGPIGELPDTVQGIIGARLDGLPGEERALLEDAAVIGEIFWDGAIAAVGDVSRQRVESLLAELDRKGFVYHVRRTSVAGEAEYAFQHILVRDVAYELIPRARRSDKHRRGAAWIESLGRGEDHAEMLGHHYWRALEYVTSAARDAALIERARLALRAAGNRALALASYAAAARFYTAALELWPESDPDRVRLLVDSGRAMHGADQTGTDLLEQAFEQLQARGEVEGAAEVAVDLARFLWIGGDRDRAYGYIDRALELTGRGGRSRARAYALVERAAYHMSANEYRQAIPLVREALPLTEGLGIDELRARALDVLGGSRAGLGDVGGLEDSTQAIAIARTCHAFSRLIVAELNQYSNYFSLGQLAAASDALHNARRDAESYGTADQRKWSRVQEAQQGVLHGRWEEATEILIELIRESDAGSAPYYLDPAAYALRASVALARGQLEAAAADSRKALHLARSAKDPQLLAPALAIRAMVQLAHGHRQQAR
jgi:tetratricopeptide (TPR) repeat protein